jgi:hypothetical protein
MPLATLGIVEPPTDAFVFTVYTLLCVTFGDSSSWLELTSLLTVEVHPSRSNDNDKYTVSILNIFILTN